MDFFCKKQKNASLLLVFFNTSLYFIMPFIFSVIISNSILCFLKIQKLTFLLVIFLNWCE